MDHFEFSEAAAQDIENIFEFGIDTFGQVQALKYQQGMAKHFDEIKEHPKSYPAVDDILPGIRRCVYKSHAIYFQIESTRIFIARILGQQDPIKALTTPK